MIRKWCSIVFLSVLLLGIGIFYYGGTETKVAATEEKFTAIQDRDEPVMEEAVPEQPEPLVNEEPPAAEEIEKPSAPPAEAEKPDQASANGPNDRAAENKPAAEEKAAPAEDEVVIDGTMYMLAMDEEKHPNLLGLITPVRNYGAALYGVPESDVFTVVKDGKPIAYMSTGVKAVLPEHAGMVKEMFTGSYAGIKEDIDRVLETGEPVTVELEEYVGYHILLEDGWLIIHYGL